MNNPQLPITGWIYMCDAEQKNPDVRQYIRRGAVSIQCTQPQLLRAGKPLGGSQQGKGTCRRLPCAGKVLVVDLGAVKFICEIHWAVHLSYVFLSFLSSNVQSHQLFLLWNGVQISRDLFTSYIISVAWGLPKIGAAGQHSIQIMQSHKAWTLLQSNFHEWTLRLHWCNLK